MSFTQKREHKVSVELLHVQFMFHFWCSMYWINWNYVLNFSNLYYMWVNIFFSNTRFSSVFLSRFRSWKWSENSLEHSEEILEGTSCPLFKRLIYKGEQDCQIWMPTCDSFWVPNEIDSWNFQHMLHLRFCEVSQKLISFRHFFS